MKLATIERRYRAAVERADDLRERRNQAIVDAVGGGMTQAEAARITGLTRGRIAQILAGD